MGLVSSSSTTASLHDHVLIVFEHHLVVFVQVKHGDRREFGGHAARLGHGTGVDRVYQGLHDGVVGGVQVVRQGEGTLAVAVERLVTGRSHDPVVPADITEVHVKRVTPAVVPVSLAPALPRLGTSPFPGEGRGGGVPPLATVVAEHQQHWHSPVVEGEWGSGSSSTICCCHVHHESMVAATRLLLLLVPALHRRQNVHGQPALLGLEELGVHQAHVGLGPVAGDGAEHVVDVEPWPGVLGVRLGEVVEVQLGRRHVFPFWDAADVEPQAEPIVRMKAITARACVREAAHRVGGGRVLVPQWEVGVGGSLGPLLLSEQLEHEGRYVVGD